MSKHFHTPKIVQGPQRWKLALVLLALLGFLAAGAWYGYRFGKGDFGGEALFSNQQQELQAELVKEMEVETKQLRTEVAKLERAAQVDAEAATELRLQLLGLEQENEQLSARRQWPFLIGAEELRTAR